MNVCVTHGRAHYPGETDSVHTLGDNLDCREEEWTDVVPGEVVDEEDGSQCERLDADAEPFFVLSSNDFAYLDTLASGLVPCKVESIGPVPDKAHLAATVLITAGRAGYERGERITVAVPSRTLVARTQVFRRKGQLRVAGPLRYYTDEGDLV